MFGLVLLQNVLLDDSAESLPQSDVTSGQRKCLTHHVHGHVLCVYFSTNEHCARPVQRRALCVTARDHVRYIPVRS